jgi:hypothetical protein
VFQHTTPAAHGIKSGLKTTAIVARTIVITSPASIIHDAKVDPSLAWGVRDYGVRPPVEARVTFFVPRINVRQPEVGPVFVHKES